MESIHTHKLIPKINHNTSANDIFKYRIIWREWIFLIAKSHIKISPFIKLIYKFTHTHNATNERKKLNFILQVFGNIRI